MLAAAVLPSTSNHKRMKILPRILSVFLLIALCQCKKGEQGAFTPEQQKEQLIKMAAEVKEEGSSDLKKADMPILPVSVGDSWTYTVTLQVPENAQSKGSPLISQSFERKRTYVGKIKPSGNHPETDCFEIEATGSPTEREFVEIEEERVQMRGSEIVGKTESLPLWMEPAVTLVQAGVSAGESLPPIQIKDPRTGAEYLRQIQIVGREKITVAGRDFANIRILMSGKDGKENPIEMRRTIWFAPGYGIVK
jgi:hypothetical protein